ncbi:MAG: zinc ABC transporter substrate-binding protein [Eubacteriales bacterium]|nr:zinc ABC transporter substrate-binding protein [Eubacteriales bacterium]
MKKTQQIMALLLAVMLCLGLFGCAKEHQASEAAGSDSGKKVVTVTTSFLNDMVKVLAGDLVELQMIIPAGEDPHLYKPLPEDSKKIQGADLVLYHGLHFEGKMVEALEQFGVSVSENFPAERIGRMDQDGIEIIDPHFWFDLELYAMACDRAAEALIELLPEHKASIEQNLEEYKVELKACDEWIRSEMEKIPENSRYLVTPHDAFNYFAKSYDIVVHAPQGVSTDSEVSGADVEATVNLIVEHQVKAIFTESTTNPAKMQKLQEDCARKGFEVKVVHGADQELFSDSLAAEGQAGDSFIEMLKHNVKLIVDNLK